jgi:hypothetical protein
MNCNKGTFYTVKYETVYYQLACPSTWNSRITFLQTPQQRLSYCKEMLENNVKDKSRQVEMTFSIFDSESNHVL